ncbi:MAG: type II toxin-antitoxin system RelE/ParE family toxin [Deltaproteobacteria bacterium]|nr:type II toxin-antitoxin system RelE/ParE family toxin [Deltaproteobacteria bacterium]MBW2283396.1 type II toxin-antitoxin system RelE/ParE family toxin [Deltaproteobacteria bacterium]
MKHGSGRVNTDCRFDGNNIKKLRDYNSDIWRYRIGSFRIFYSVDTSEKVVYLPALDHRKDAYR